MLDRSRVNLTFVELNTKKISSFIDKQHHTFLLLLPIYHAFLSNITLSSSFYSSPSFWLKKDLTFPPHPFIHYPSYFWSDVGSLGENVVPTVTPTVICLGYNGHGRPQYDFLFPRLWSRQNGRYVRQSHEKPPPLLVKHPWSWYDHSSLYQLLFILSLLPVTE